MERAALLIGVNSTGNLPQLQAACAGARQMEAWAKEQEFQHVKTLTDEAGPVRVEMIKDAIEEIVSFGTVEQLVIYFAGHGFNRNYSEYWLLSRAPADADAAVNVEGTTVLARQGPIPHVVLISDACRTAAEGLQAQQVNGSLIFPNFGGGGLEKDVDAFFGCTLGRPAQEIREANASAAAFRAVYTDALLDALRGRPDSVLEFVQERGEGFGVVRPRNLKRHLQEEVPRRIRKAGLQPSVTQDPDARIVSEPSAWLSRVKVEQPRATPQPDAAAPATIRTQSSSLLKSALTAPEAAMVDFGPSALAAELHPKLVEAISADMLRTGPDHFETMCGFTLQGARVAEAFSPGAQVSLGQGEDIIRVHQIDGPAANVLIRTTAGTGVLLPAIPEFIATLRFDEGELASVSYEPSRNSRRWPEFEWQSEEIRLLRAIIASSAGEGTFRLDREDAGQLARRMQHFKGLDPVLAIYAAYAFNGLGERERLQGMVRYLWNDLHIALFDVVMLAGVLHQPEYQRAIFPPFPMLAQGWEVLTAYGAESTPLLRALHQQVQPSLWTLFSAKGVDLLHEALASGRL